jgi:hypothetical protein
MDLLMARQEAGPVPHRLLKSYTKLKPRGTIRLESTQIRCSPDRQEAGPPKMLI